MADTSNRTPELSVIVPVLNEAAAIAALLDSLARQEKVAMEVILSDGGSTDGTPEAAARHDAAGDLRLRILTGPPGRARQLNLGAAEARGATLLFLHADSLFTDPLAFREGLDRLAAAIEVRGNDRVAGRFALRFIRQDSAPSAGYYHFECKARLNRPECIHGDQGFLMRRTFFDAAGPFSPDFPMLAETQLADTVHAAGEWLLLPAEIMTSARRFETEGLRERQTINAIIMNFAAARWLTFFRELPHIYRNRHDDGPLRLQPMLRDIARLMGELPPGERFRLWYATGRYVRDNAWQLALARDTRNNFRRGLPPGTGSLPLLHAYDRFLNPLTDHPPGRLLAALLTWLWLRLGCLGYLQQAGQRLNGAAEQTKSPKNL
jgi:rSAM/selenodomain-associated transferase 2